MTGEPRHVRRIDDPEVLKGLAQPIRQKLWRMLLQQGPCTVGTLAQQLGADPGQVSYHLRELARRGWVEHAPDLARDRRESWWRAIEESTAWRIEDFPTPEGTALVLHLGKQMLRENLQRLQAFMQNYPRMSPQWRAAMDSSQSFLHLTPDEARAMNAELNEVLARWARHGDHARQRGDTDDRLPYLHFMYGFPEGPTDEGDR
jgi:Mn-dependent DtxR family transcriptional regulator